MAPERRVETQPGWEPEWEPSVPDGPEAGYSEGAGDGYGEGYADDPAVRDEPRHEPDTGELAQDEPLETGELAQDEPLETPEPAAGEAGADEGENPFGRRSLYEELGLSLDLYDTERGDEPSIAGLLERHANGRDQYDVLDPADPSVAPPGSLGTETATYSFGGTTETAYDAAGEFGTGYDTAGGTTYADDTRRDAGPVESAARPVPSYDIAPRIASHRHRPTSDNLTAERVLRQRRTPPTRGWRKAVLGVTGGTVNLGPSAKELRRQELEERCRVPIHGCHKLAVISLKGGVGKTTTVAALGSMFATLRGDRVIAVDANPDRGTLGEKIIGEVTATVRDFVGRSPRLQRYSDVREFTAQAPSRLEVLSSESDPLASMAFSEQDYRVVSDVLERFYSLILTDCGTGLLHSAMVGVLAMADQIIVVSSASLDGARSASATLDWLDAHGYEALANDSVTVISSVRPRAEAVDLDEIEDHFAARSRAVVRIPYDPHLSAGGRIELDELKALTYESYLHLAAEVAEGFARTGR